MADRSKRLRNNVPGEFFVDSTCINCDTCRQLAPQTFGEADDFSFVRLQPTDAAGRRRAFQALAACPTGSIGALDASGARQAADDFPMPLEEGIYYCGFNSPKSFGGNSYFVRRETGNWLIDSPRFTGRLARRFEEMGGVARIFLTHRDDVADAAAYASRFGSRRVIHRLELSAQPDAEEILDGMEPRELGQGFFVIPTPGHTRGHCALLYRNRYLFTGDHLWWDRDLNHLDASRSHCWHSWREQTASMAALAGYTFEWVLPGHGERVRLAADEMRRQVQELSRRMRRAA
jgi:glyoxylase-like metal-dependent hydrolase (beta-lactamase superfamily II)/ferredoxin